MGEEIKYLDLQGLTLYDQNIKQWGTTKNEEIKIKQTNGKSDNGTILVTPGGTTPATRYTAEEAAAYNTEHSLSPEDPDYKHEGDIKTEASTSNTNIEVNIDNDTLIQDPTTKQIKVASAALTQYIGDEDAQGNYAINISEPDANNNKKVSLDINSDSNVFEKTSTGVLAKVEIHQFADPSQFGSNVKEAFALSANNVVLTGTSNEQVIKIYKDSALLDIKLLHAVPATYYTAEEAEEYNTEHGLNPGDEGYKNAGDEKTAAVKPTYSKIGGWVDIEASLRTEANVALCYAYENTDGAIVVEAIPVGNYLKENEFKAGLQVNAQGEVSVKIDNTSENFLTVSNNGVKLAGVQDAIDEAAADAKTTITEIAADDPIPAGGAAKIIVTKTVEADGHANYVISGQDLASAIALAAEVLRAQTAEQAIDSVVGLEKASNSEVRTYTNTGNYIGQQTTNTVKSDIKALDTKLKQVSDKLDSFVAITSEEINSLFA